jgi:hypothetical protein
MVAFAKISLAQVIVAGETKMFARADVCEFRALLSRASQHSRQVRAGLAQVSSAIGEFLVSTPAEF